MAAALASGLWALHGLAFPKYPIKQANINPNPLLVCDRAIVTDAYSDVDSTDLTRSRTTLTLIATLTNSLWALHGLIFPKYLKKRDDVNPRNPNVLLAYDGAIVTEFFSPRFPEESVFMRQTISSTNPITAGGRYSEGAPPHHYHLYQTEFFEVESGLMGYVVDGVTKVAKPGEKVTVLPGEKHTWWVYVDPDNLLDLVVKISADPAMDTMDEAWFRNLYGGFEAAPNRSPSVFHLFYILDRGDVVLADPPKPIGWLLNVVLGRFIGGVIGRYRYHDVFTYPTGVQPDIKED